MRQERSDGPDPANRPEPPQLTQEECLLVELRDWLYDGDWSAMLADLTARLTGRPYLFELFGDLPDELARRERMAADIVRIARLAALEPRSPPPGKRKDFDG